ncbi:MULTISPECIES: ABC transporter permease [unclassified Streptomyces]|uniref:ABC transporter permease n=1 Tax=unclassified Streptomyces TaxID=2593676 RepID=UPI002E2B3537|nr:ABC transporter permease [Streptomyces sp. NBC_00223]
MTVSQAAGPTYQESVPDSGAEEPPEPRGRLVLPGPVPALVLLVVLLAGWEAGARAGFINPLFFSSPEAIGRKAVDVFITHRTIYPDLLFSGRTLAIGFLLSVVIGIPIGLVIGRYRLVRRTVEPYIIALYSTPAVALLPVLILILGIGVTSNIALVVLGGVFPIIINTQTGVREVDRNLVEMARSFTAGERFLFTKVILPAAVPFVMAGLRLGIIRALTMVFVAELYSANEGIGHLIVQAGSLFDSALVYVGVLVMTLTGLLLSFIAGRLERKFAPWISAREGDSRGA